MQKITTFLWFDHQAEEAAQYYTSIFPDSRIVNVQHTGPDGNVLMVVFELAGQRFMALNGGPEFAFTEAISLYVDCADQAEVDQLWKQLTEGGQEGPCGWLKDRYGLSWQVIPSELQDLVGGPDPDGAQRAMQAMLGMHKIDVQGLRDAYAG